MEQNIYDILVNGLDLNAFYSFIDSKTELNHNTPVQKGGRHAKACGPETGTPEGEGYTIGL